MIAPGTAPARHNVCVGREERVIVGTGQHGMMKLSDEAEAFFKGHGWPFGMMLKNLRKTNHLRWWYARAGRTITPRAMMQSNERQYLIAYCHAAEIEKTYRLDRIVKIRVADS